LDGGPDSADLGVARPLQQTEIPGPSAQRIQHDLRLAVCGCGREHVAPRPPEVPDATVSIGPRVRALAVYLVVFRHMPVERCRGLIADVTGAEVSAGFIHSCLRAAADLSAEVVTRHAALQEGLARIPATVADPLIKEFRHAVLAGLASIPRIPGPKHSTAQHPGRDLLEFCRDRQADALRFTTDTQIWPTNNISEHGVRPNKMQQKISGRLTSEDATQDRLDIRSYIDTARKHGRNIMTVLHDLFLGNPWQPPLPALSP
jgi:hypothetical protein